MKKTKNLEIKHGSYYKTRCGLVVGPVVKICDVCYPYWIPSYNFMCYRKDGLVSLTGWIESEHDLVDLVQL